MSAAVPNMHSYSTEAKCTSAVSAAKKAGKKIGQNCTYAGPMFLWMQTASGPYIAQF
ncbi:hypothetical protein [Leifsonia sp. NPDC058248]|uniref:hypothetical protein n=1 Tax=Leifsonia sp. NPDC058248 TaxID=3346402 RepID=UPI0036DBB0C5